MTLKTVHHRMTFEEALDETGYGRYTWLLCLVCSTIIMGVTFEIFSISYLVPASSSEWEISCALQGMLMYVPLIGAAASFFLWGYLADTRGRRKMLIISMAITYVVATLASFSPHWVVFILLKLVSAASASGASVITVTLLCECTRRANRSFMIFITIASYMVAIGIMAVVSLPILPLTESHDWSFLGIHFNAWRVLNLIYAVPCALSVIGCYYVYESPKYLVSVDRQKAALQVLQTMYAMNTGKSADKYKAFQPAVTVTFQRPSYRSSLLQRGEPLTDDPLESLRYDIHPDQPHSTMNDPAGTSANNTSQNDAKANSSGPDEGQSPSLHKGVWDSILAQATIMKPPFLKTTLILILLFVISFNTMIAFIVWLPFIFEKYTVAVMDGRRDLNICQMIRFTPNTSTIEVVDHCSANNSSATLLAVFGATIFLGFRNILAGTMINRFGRRNLFILVQVEAAIAALTLNFNDSWIMAALMITISMSGIFNFGNLYSYIIDGYPTYLRATAVSFIQIVAFSSSVVGIHFLKQLLDTNCEVAFYVFGGIALANGLFAILLPTQPVDLFKENFLKDVSTQSDANDYQPNNTLRSEDEKIQEQNATSEDTEDLRQL